MGPPRAADCGAALAPLTPDAYLAHLGRACDAFAARLVTGDLHAAVPDCPGWTLTDLAHHLGGVHRWAWTAVVEGRPGPETADAPTDRAALVGWFRDGAAALLDTLGATGPTTPCWTFGPRPHVAAFWFRRQAHETVLHARDAGAAGPLDPALAVDGVDEVVTMFFPRQRRLGRTAPLPAALGLTSTEGGRWVLGRDGDPDATVSGPAEALLLLLWHRIGLDDPRLAVSGSRAAADAVLAAALTP
jgi:uncharacterized protein (TIGR03083 family)